MRLLVLKYFTIALPCILYQNANSQQTITGTFPALSYQQLKLAGFEGFDTYTIDSVRVNAKGNFSLSFRRNDYGMGYLVAEDNKPFIVILAPGENVNLEGESLSLPETVIIRSGKQNQLFEKYATEHPRREQTLSAWDFLAKIYNLDPLFARQEKPKNAIEAEKHRIREEDRMFLAGLNPDTYVSWYLPLRKLVSSVPTLAQYRTEEIAAAIEAFRVMDYTDNKLYKSGLLRETIDAHFWLIENSGRALDSVYTEMKVSIDHLIENLITDERKLNLITDYLFNFLEKRSLFEASEYLALKVLNETHCTINDDLAAQLESYRAMKHGTIATDFAFPDDRLAPGYASAGSPKKLSDIKSKYTLMVFGASWCPACPEELFQISGLYEKWKRYGVEVVFVSLDQDKQTFKNFSGIFPFISMCDYQKYDSPVVKAYHVFATPTLYLLNDKREILLRPNSASHMDSWVEWYL
ncbi:MAG: AhpC/TSA family protein, partial [Bacteroidales bacterium]|nr:AhpC/TSA family protein [Bacteroidales bacterium]